ncbi:hypothetical protein ERO13_D04G174928v2 [Gossypium hirsutum]|nr:hypothetical protein ERO13_D04G174928v2 [Gossypium hirsutum]
MAPIDAVNLVANHVHRWMLRDGSGTLPAGRIVLTVTEDENQWWQFECRSEGDRHYITGTEWSRFVQPRINAMLTLYAQQDGRYRICGEDWRRFVESNVGAVLTLYAGEGDNATYRLEVRR